ncbi:hypothetical protein Tco_1417873 [Tanacetum coccineum]
MVVVVVRWTSVGCRQLLGGGDRWAVLQKEVNRLSRCDAEIEREEEFELDWESRKGYGETSRHMGWDGGRNLGEKCILLGVVGKKGVGNVGRNMSVGWIKLWEKGTCRMVGRWGYSFWMEWGLDSRGDGLGGDGGNVGECRYDIEKLDVDLTGRRGYCLVSELIVMGAASEERGGGVRWIMGYKGVISKMRERGWMKVDGEGLDTELLGGINNLGVGVGETDRCVVGREEKRGTVGKGRGVEEELEGWGIREGEETGKMQRAVLGDERKEDQGAGDGEDSAIKVKNRQGITKIKNERIEDNEKGKEKEKNRKDRKQGKVSWGVDGIAVRVFEDGYVVEDGWGCKDVGGGEGIWKLEGKKGGGKGECVLKGVGRRRGKNLRQRWKNFEECMSVSTAETLEGEVVKGGSAYSSEEKKEERAIDEKEDVMRIWEERIKELSWERIGTGGDREGGGVGGKGRDDHIGVEGTCGQESEIYASEG